VRSRKNISQVYIAFLAIIGLGFLVFITWRQPAPPLALEYPALILLVALLAYFPIGLLLKEEISLIQTITLGSGILYGPSRAGWAVTLGILVGYVATILLKNNSFTSESKPFLKLLKKIGREIGLQLIPLIITLNPIYWESRGRFNAFTFSITDVLYLTLVFAILHGSLYLVDLFLRGQTGSPTFTQDLTTVALIELIPLPFILLGTIAFPTSRLGALVAIGVLPIMMAVLLQGAGQTRQDLIRRLQDLSTLNRVSQALRASLEMDSLLPVIQEQVTKQLDVNNFYVALYDTSEKEIWYPLAVKNGVRQSWPRRALTDRLTDRVIRERRPILLAHDASQELARIGLPPSEDAPFAWLGVPLITAERTIGCLAVFSTSPEVGFNTADLNLLTTLSGQVSVAIENALLFEQTQRRAAQLENLNRISTLITASLEPQEAFAQVCRSATQVSGGEHSAIFLIDSEQRLIRLAYSQALSDDFVKINGSFPYTDESRTRCLRTGRPTLISDISQLSQYSPFLESLTKESIRAYGDFPLVTPQGQIGFLAVYFTQPTTIPPEMSDILQTFASQAAVAVANARLYAQTDMALTRRAHQLVILENIGRELAAAIHSEGLFQMILDYALEFTNSPWGSLSISEPKTEHILIKASRGYRLDEIRYPTSIGVVHRVISTRQVVNIKDVRKDPDYLDLTGGASRSLLSVPLVHEQRVLGVLTLESPDLDAFSQNDQIFINQLANQAAIAVVNATLYTEARRQLKAQARLYEYSKALVGKLEVKQVLDTIVSAISEALESFETGIYLYNELTRRYELRAVSNNEYGEVTHLESHIDEPVLRRSRSKSLGTGLLQLTKGQDQPGSPLSPCRDCQVLMIPLESGPQKLGIVIAHLPQEVQIDEINLQLPQALATQGAIAIQNAELFADVEQGRDRLEAVLDAVADGVIMVDARGTIILGNAAYQEITELPLEDIFGKRLMELDAATLKPLGLTPGTADQFAEKFGQKGRFPSPKITLQRKTGLEKVIERFSAPVFGYGRQPIGWVIVLRDISEEHRLNQAREMITETLVHDLRSPMGAVSSALTLLEESLPEGERDPLSTQSLDIAHRSTRKVLTLIDSLLDISRLDSGRMELDVSSFSPFHLGSDLFEELTPQAKELGIVFRNEIEADAPLVYGDMEMIVRVLTNLLDNALKFTPEGGQVILSTDRLEEGKLIFKVSDTGPGVPIDYREKIFDRFTQIPGYRGRRRGSGIGLTFCKLAVEAHQETIWVEPRPGEGSIFAFTLPTSLPQTE
jgi:PAS domain S-box-containing protein